MGSKTAKAKGVSRSRAIKGFADFVNEKSGPAYKLPPDAREVWDHVCEILPEFKSSSWESNYGGGGGILFISPNSKLSEKPMSHLSDERGQEVEDVLGDMQIGYSDEDPEEEIEKGFWMTTQDGYLLQHPSTTSDSDGFRGSMNPIELAMIFDPDTTTKYMVKHKHSGWQKAAAKHIGLL